MWNAQLRQAILVVSRNHWELNYWTYRDQRHSTFICLYLNRKQKVRFAYRSYSHQVESHLLVKSFLQGQRRDQNLSRSNRLPFRVPIGPHRTEYWEYQTVGSKRALKYRQNILVLRVKLKSKLSPEILDIHLLTSREMGRSRRFLSKFTSFDNRLPSWSQNHRPISRN